MSNPRQVSPRSVSSPRILFLALPRANPSVHRLFRAHRFEAAWVDSGSMAEALVEKEAFDVVIVDSSTPGLDVFELGRSLRQRLSSREVRLPMLLVWEGPVRRVRRRALRAGFDDVVSSPFDAADFCLRVRNLARRTSGSPPRPGGRSVSAARTEALGSLVFGVAHDFNNILTIIGAYAHFLKSQASPEHPMQDDINEISAAVKRAEALTRHLLAFTRRGELRLEPTEIDPTLLNMERILRRLIGEDVVVELDLRVEGRAVNLDVAEFERVMLNLAANARDAMPRGGRFRISTRELMVPSPGAARPETEQGPATEVLVSVSDTGVGMTEEVRRHLFEPYFTTKSEGLGTGLGLATVRAVVDSFGGRIDVRTEVGEGTVFNLYLPVVQKCPQPKPRLSLVPSPASSHSAGTILLAEDDDGVREATRRALENRGFRVLSASSPTDALRIGVDHGNTIDLLLSDVVMPGMSGVELALRIRAARAGLPVLLMSGRSEQFAMAQGERPEGFGWLQKPVMMDALVSRVSEVLTAEPKPEARALP